MSYALVVVYSAVSRRKPGQPPGMPAPAARAGGLSAVPVPWTRDCRQSRAAASPGRHRMPYPGMNRDETGAGSRHAANSG